MSLGERIDIANHPELQKYLSDYKGILDFIEGSITELWPYLIKYEAEDSNTKEAQAHFSTRLQRLYHKPVMEPSHQIHLAHLSQKINWGGIQDSSIKDFLDDVTGQQQPAAEFLDQILSYRLALGRVGILVDATTKIKAGETKAEARESGDRSYQILYRADQIKYWEFARTGSRKGQIVRLVLCDEPEYTEKGEKRERLRRFFYPPNSDTYVWQLLREAEEKGTKGKSTSAAPGKWQVIAEGQGELSRIPFVMWGQGLKDSLFRKVWQLEKANLNNGSVKSNIIYKQGFQRTIVAGAKDHELKKVGESIINKVQDPDAKVYTIEPGDPDASFREEGLIESRAQRMALLQHNQLVDDTKQIQSAESKEKDMAAREKYYNKILDQAERKLKEIWTLHYEFEGLSGAESIEISIIRDLGLKSADVEMKERSNLTFLAKQANVPEVVKEVLITEISRANFTVIKDDETEEELKERLYSAVESAAEIVEPTQPQPGASTASQRPSVGEALRPNGGK